MKNIMRMLALTLATLLSLTVSAAAIKPVAGKMYRIRSICAASYLTMSAKDDASVTLNENPINSEYQMWEVEVSGSTYNIKNVGWSKGGQPFYLSCASLERNAPIMASTEATSFTLKDAVSDGNWECFTISPSGKSSLGLCTDMNGSKFILDNLSGNGIFWLFEEAELLIPEIVTMKSARSGKYIAENNNNQLIQAATVNDKAKWIKYEDMEGGILFINYDTHNIIQTPQKSKQVSTGTEHVYFYADQGDGVWAFWNSGMYLNETSTYVCGWNQGLTDKGSCWYVDKVGEISENEVLDILSGGSAYLREVKEGVYFRIFSEPLSYYMTEDYRYDRVSGCPLDENDLTQVWEAVPGGKDGFYIRNVITGRYLTSTTALDAEVKATTTGTVYEPTINTALSKVNPYFNFISAGGLCPMVTGDRKITNSYPGTKEVSGAEWLLVRVDKLNDNALKDQKAAYDEFMRSYALYHDMLDNQSQISSLLREIFADEACTTLTAAAQAMTTAQFDTKIASLPTFMQDICRKVKNDSWTKTKGGRQMEKFFRIADYKAYSNSFDMRDVIGMSHEFTHLSNPTGVTAEPGDIIAIFVDRDCPSGAQLKLEMPDGDEWASHNALVQGETVVLKKGLNLVLVGKSCDMFIYYEINSTADTRANYLESYPDIKIHIEGGSATGYFDMTRGMTDVEWSDMVKSDMLRHGRVFIKGDRVLGNWPSSVLIANNSETILDVASFYNNVATWEQEMMGINETYMPNITRRYNNLLLTLGTQLQPGDYMYATGQGTYYNRGTLGDILSKNVLKNGGLQWGPAHELGHNHQELFNMVGCTEVSNNGFANMVIYKMGASMSRGVGLSALIPDYAANKNWLDHSIWCQTQLYWKLYQYFHIAGYDTEFYPKLFAVLRANPMNNKPVTLVPSSNDYLHFAEACCEAAGADLSDLFEMYGFFAPMTTNTTYEGVNCRHIDDYKQFYIYTSDAMIAAAKARMQAYDKKMKNIGFIDDRIRATPATYPGAAAGTMRSAMNGGGANGVGSEGTVGMYLDYMPENYRQASGYTLKSISFTSNQLKVTINKDGEGAMGFKVYDSNDNLLYFYNDFSFTVPSSVYKLHPYAKDNIIVVVADAQGRDQVVYRGDNYTGSLADGITTPSSTVNYQLSTPYDLQGRRVINPTHGLFIINGKKVVK